MKKNKTIMVLVLFIAAACNIKTDRQKLKDYVNAVDGKITQSLTVGDVTAVARFLPSSQKSLRQNSTSGEIASDAYYFFDVKFDKKGSFKPETEKVMYLNFEMQNDFLLLIDNKDSIMPAICQRIENGISNVYEYMLAFEKGVNAKDNQFTLFYKDKIFSVGTVAFVYKEKDLIKYQN